MKFDAKVNWFSGKILEVFMRQKKTFLFYSKTKPFVPFQALLLSTF